MIWERRLCYTNNTDWKWEPVTGRRFSDSRSKLGSNKGREQKKSRGLLLPSQALIPLRPTLGFLPLLHLVSPHLHVCLMNE